MNIANKTIILTGASRIGKDVAKVLYENGANLAVSYFTSVPKFEFAFDDSKVLFVQGDLANSADAQKLVSECAAKFGTVDGLVHLAANYNRTSWNELDERAWEKSINPIAKSAYLLGKAVGDQMLKQKTVGKMVFISDWSVLFSPYKDFLPYNTAKTAIQGLTKSLAVELAPKISVNCIAPGPILRPDNLTDEENQEVINNTPLKQWGGAHEIALAVEYLLKADFVTGQVLYVDGGRSIG